MIIKKKKENTYSVMCRGYMIGKIILTWNLNILNWQFKIAEGEEAN